MKFTLSTVLFILPLAILASPVPEDGPAPPTAPEGATSDADLDTRAIFARSPQDCKIGNANDYVNCRAGPSTDARITNYPLVGTTYRFQCYKNGSCFNGNCTWDKLVWNGGFCYVNGYFTDNNCTPARLGLC